MAYFLQHGGPDVFDVDTLRTSNQDTIDPGAASTHSDTVLFAGSSQASYNQWDEIKHNADFDWSAQGVPFPSHDVSDVSSDFTAVLPYQVWQIAPIAHGTPLTPLNDEPSRLYGVAGVLWTSSTLARAIRERLNINYAHRPSSTIYVPTTNPY